MVAAQQKAWDAACRAWSLDEGRDPEKTGALGERLMYAATDLIVALEDGGAPDPRAEVRNVYRYLRDRWGHAVTRDETRRAKTLRIAFDAIATEWPDEIAADEEE